MGPHLSFGCESVGSSDGLIGAKRGGHLLDSLRGSFDTRSVQPAAALAPGGGEERHPFGRGCLYDDVRGCRLAPLPRPALPVEMDRIAPIACEANNPRGW